MPGVTVESVQFQVQAFRIAGLSFSFVSIVENGSENDFPLEAQTWV